MSIFLRRHTDNACLPSRYWCSVPASSVPSRGLSPSPQGQRDHANERVVTGRVSRPADMEAELTPFHSFPGVKASQVPHFHGVMPRATTCFVSQAHVAGSDKHICGIQTGRQVENSFNCPIPSNDKCLTKFKCTTLMFQASEDGAGEETHARS